MFFKRLFKRREINPFSVTDKAVFRNGDKTLTLHVKADAFTLILGLKRANDKLAQVKDDSTDDEKRDAARMFAATIFGTEQADRLMDFYEDPLTVIRVCGMYFNDQLKEKITKAQKR